MDLTDEQWALIQPIISSTQYLSREGTDRGPISNCSHGEEEDPAQLSNPNSPNSMPGNRGRPPADPRATLNGILRKMRLSAPWYDLPPLSSAQHPSWQTCYRRYRNWQTAGLMDHIYRLLYQDLRDRAGIDVIQALQVGITNFNPACGQGTIPLTWDDSGWHLHLPAELEGTWQASTVHLLVQVILRHLKPPLRPRPSRTLKIEYHNPEQHS